jgi:hypothetical protein
MITFISGVICGIIITQLINRYKFYKRNKRLWSNTVTRLRDN